jgi:hypothetical protein
MRQYYNPARYEARRDHGLCVCGQMVDRAKQRVIAAIVLLLLHEGGLWL